MMTSNVGTLSAGQRVAVECRSVWKIFGDRAQEALQACRDGGLNKAEINEQYDCVVGVADASFNVHEGEIFCIMGLSGSGKSTLVRHINRLLEPTSGEILINDRDVMGLNEESLRQMRAEQIGMVFQNNALLPHRTVRDNVALPLEVQGVSKRQRYQVAEQALSLVDLNGWEDNYAHELSGGMQQRVGLARALAMDLAKTGVTINAVCPGWVDTDMVSTAVDRITAKTGRSSEESRASLAKMTPQGRIIQPKEVAHIVNMLVAPEALGIHGQTLVLDGGQILK